MTTDYSVDALVSEIRSEDFPQYAYALALAANLAVRLGVQRWTALELGVAGGNGLLELEGLAALIEQRVDTTIDIFGFDLGSGMPSPIDYRDMPYIWKKGFYQMDEAALRSRLTRASLLMGDVRTTGPAFIDVLQSPLGVLSFDLDYYSSTQHAMESLLQAPAESYLPRAVCYFDDTVGPHEELHSEWTGELLAIKQFNDEHDDRKLARINGLRYKRLPVIGEWLEGLYVLHLFDHPLYNNYIYSEADRQFPLQRSSSDDNT